MNRLAFAVMVVCVLASACGGRPSPTATPLPAATPIEVVTATSAPTDTPVPLPTDAHVPPTQTPEPTSEVPEGVRRYDDIREEQDRGGMIVRVTGIAIAPFEVLLEGLEDDTAKWLFEESEAFKNAQAVVTLGLEVENTTDKQLSVYPDQGTIIIGNEQIELAQYCFSSKDVGGDVFPGVMKVGLIICSVNRTPSDQLSSLRYVFDSPHDEDFARVADEDYDFTITLE